MAQLYELYNEVDTYLENELNKKQTTPVCQKGCSQCCSHYFHVSEIEMILIMKYIFDTKGIDKLQGYLEGGEVLWNKFKEEYPEYARRDEEDLSENINSNDFVGIIKNDINGMPITTSFPCIFLNKETNACNVYEVRPFICRTHGVGFMNTDEDYAVCEKIQSWMNNYDRMVNIVEFGEKIQEFELVKSQKHKTAVFFRPHSIFSFLHYFYTIDKTIPIHQRKTFTLPFTISKEQYVNLKIDKVLK